MMKMETGALGGKTSESALATVSSVGDHKGSALGCGGWHLW
jgi:hypothetical protein